MKCSPSPKLVTLFSFLIFSGISFAQNRAEKANSLLWEISGKGAAKKGFLYGTMHVPEKMVFNLSDSFFIALQYSDYVALETDHDLWQDFTEKLQGGNPDGSMNNYLGLSTDRTGDLYREAWRLPSPHKLTLSGLLAARPVMTNEYLYRTNQYRQDYEEDTYLDLFIFQAGKKLGKKVIGLENLEYSYECLIRAGLPDEDKEESYYQGYGADPSAIEEAYRDQDLDRLDSLSKSMRPGKNFQKWMLDIRNEIMADGIDSILSQGHSIFAAVGAAHLPGEMGVIKMLRRMGYVVRPVQFKAEPHRLNVDRIESIRFPVVLETQWAHDSLFSTKAPSRFYAVPNFSVFKEYMSADMSNGAFYAVYRLPSNGWWNGQSQEYLSGRIDSFIYENIPGKISLRKRFEQPFPGHEITTKTRRGDYYRYKIFVTPLEIIMFMTGGNGEYALGKEADAFLEEIRFREIPAVSHTGNKIRPSHGGFQIDMPGLILRNTTEDKKAEDMEVISLDIAGKDSVWYYLGRVELHDTDYIEEDSFELNIMGENIAATFTKSPPTVLSENGAPFPSKEIEFRSDKDSAWYYVKLLIDGPRYYAAAVRKKEKAYPEAFFKSFQPAPTFYPEGYAQKFDSTLEFKSQILAHSEDTVGSYVLKIQKITEDYYKNLSRKTDWGYGGAYEKRWASFRSRLTGEHIYVIKDDIVGTFPTIDSFYQFARKRFTRNGKMNAGAIDWRRDKNRMIAQFTLTDTNSNRGVKVLSIVSNRKILSVAAVVNTDRPVGEFITRFFDQFEPVDSTEGEFILDKPDLSFLSDIYAADTLIREEALEKLSKIWQSEFDESDLPALIRAVETAPDFYQLKSSDQNVLFSGIEKVKSKMTEKYLADFYRRHQDSIQYRTMALNSMFRLKTGSALKKALDLYMQDPLLLDFTGLMYLGEVFDSLELSAEYYSRILKLGQLPQNSEFTAILSANLLHNGMIRPKQYASIVPGLKLETTFLINRTAYNAEVAKKSEQNRMSADYYYNSYEEVVDPALVRNLYLLAPSAQKDKSVSALFQKAIKMSGGKTRAEVLGVMLENSLPVDGAEVNRLLKDSTTTYPMFIALKKAAAKSSQRFEVPDSVSLAESYILDARSGITLEKITFLSAHRAVLNGTAATLYFFDIQTKGAEEKGLAYLTVADDHFSLKTSPGKNRDKNRIRFYANAYDVQAAGDVEMVVEEKIGEKEKKELINKKIGEIRFKNRERYRKEAAYAHARYPGPYGY